MSEIDYTRDEQPSSYGRPWQNWADEHPRSDAGHRTGSGLAQPQEHADGHAAEVPQQAHPVSAKDLDVFVHYVDVGPDQSGVLSGSALHPEEPVAPLTPQAAFEAARRANDPTAASAEATEFLSERIPELLATQAAARRGANPELQSKRARFERAAALSVEGHQGVQASLNAMSEKVLDYIMRTRDTPETQQKALARLGADPQKGIAGAVGDDHETMLAVLQEGNVRERMVALQGFQKMVGEDVLKPDGLERMKEIFGSAPAGSETTAEGPARFGSAEVERLEERLRQYEKEQPVAAKRNTKGLFGPLLSERSAGGRHEDYAAAKDQNMDTKLPGLQASRVAEFMGTEVPAGGPAVTGTGEQSPLARTSLTVAEAQAQGIKLSPRELAAAGGPEGTLPWVMGSTANMVDPSAPYIVEAREASMPLKTGISGTTHRIMGTAELLGADPAMARLAAFSMLTGVEAHSFHEVASTAQGFAGGYDPANPYTPSSMGLSQAQLEQIATSQGLSLADLNKNLRSHDPTLETSLR